MITIEAKNYQKATYDMQIKKDDITDAAESLNLKFYADKS